MACELARLKPAGTRAVLLYPQSIEFIVAFFACLRAGITAVPLSLPINRQDQARLLGAIQDCNPGLVLTLGSIGRMPEMTLLAQARPDLTLLFTDEKGGPEALDADLLKSLPQHLPDDVAFLQYTSGSTGAPKGVMVTHANIMANQYMIANAFQCTPKDVGLTWLPLYHDMGLIGFVMHSIYVGGLNYLMSPLDFLKRPASWLEAISQYKVTISGAPDFAYSLCTNRLTDDVISKLDLSHWRIAQNGAEPIKASVLDAFTEKFRSAGFNPFAHFPCYGLAEATLFVSGGPHEQQHRTFTLDEQSLEQGIVKTTAQKGRVLVSAGKIADDLDVRIVNPTNLEELGTAHVGEIWVRGSSIASGYWNKPEISEQIFHARLSETDGAFLRTGDLGFITEDEHLVITGRLKDLIILNGRNFYPQDFETVAERAHHSLRAGSSAVFLAGEHNNNIVVVVEVKKTEMAHPDLQSIKTAVRRALTEEFGVPIFEIVVAANGEVLKTTSGKIRRSDCREAWLNGRLLDAGKVQLSV